MMASTTCTVLAPVWRRTSSVTACWPLKMANVRLSAMLSSTLPTSRTRMGEPATFLMMMSRKSTDVFHAAHRADAHFGVPAHDASAGGFDVFGADGAFDILGRQVVGGQFVEIEVDVNLPVLPAADVHAADVVHGFERPADLLVGDLGQLANGAVARHHQRDHRIGVRIDFLHDRRKHVRRQVPHRAADLFPNVVGRLRDIALHHEGDGDVGRSLADAGLHFVDAADRGDSLFERHNYLRSNLFRRSARQQDLYIDGGRIAAGNKSTPSWVNDDTPSTTRNMMSMNAKTGLSTQISDRRTGVSPLQIVSGSQLARFILVSYSSMTPQQPKIHLTNAADYREGYANSVQIRVNLWDFFLLFGVVNQTAPDQVSIQNFQGVYVSPQQAKALLNVLQQNVSQYEGTFGEIKLEPQSGGNVVQ